MTIAAMQAAADLLDASDVGYDQGQRWTYLDQVTRTIIPHRETDCSASCAGIVWLGGYPIDLSGTMYTGNFAAKARAAGFQVLRFARLDQVQPGDFVVAPGHHVVFARDTYRWWSAEHDERGRSAGGQAGDQSGRECRYRPPYMRPGGWTYILRPPTESSPRKIPTVPPLRDSTPLLVVDGVLGVKTLKAMQSWVGTVADGIWGSATTRALQAKVGAKVDGVIGPETTRKLQAVVGAKVDGQWGPHTTAALQRYLNTH